MILADENIYTCIVESLRDADFEVISVTELNKGIKDEQVIEWTCSTFAGLDGKVS